MPLIIINDILPETIATLEKKKQSALVISHPDGKVDIIRLEKAPTYQKFREALNNGYLEVIRRESYEALCDEEGLLKELDYNPCASNFMRQNLVGPVIILVGIDVDNEGDYVLRKGWN